MKVVILAGGLGTRLSEETDIRPKPMVEIGGKPILWHIMKIYSYYGYNDFVICCGYKAYSIKQYFANYFLHQADLTVDMTNNEIKIHKSNAEPWKITLVDTGMETMTGGRVKRIKDHIGNEPFMLTYGDGVSNVNIPELVKFHQEQKKIATVTVVQPSGRFGSIQFNEEDEVKVFSFQEKPKGDGSWINGGFFVCQPEIFDYIEGDSTIFERAPLETLAAQGELVAYRHQGFWRPMDTLRDKIDLEEAWNSSSAEWKLWKMKKLNRPCPICHSTEGEKLHTQKFGLPQNHLLPSSYDVVCCPLCGFVFADSTASQETYDEFYQEMSRYEDKNTASGGGDKGYDLQRIEATAQTIADFVKDKSANILDIGCGNGGLLKSLKKKGYKNVVGLDPSHVCVQNVKAKDIEAYQGGLFKENPSGKTYDLIILSHVFEHIFDLQKATKGLDKFLKEDGCVYVETPDASRYSQFYITPYYYFDTEHINHFDKNAQCNLFETQGYCKILSEEKNMCVSENQMYPAVYSFFKRGCKLNTNIFANETLKKSVLSYIALSQNDSTLYSHIQNLVETQQKVIVWGAGNYTFRILAATNLDKANIQFFVDSDSKKWGQTILEKPIISPQALLDKNETYPILVISALFSLEIKGQIEVLGLKNKVIF